MTDRLNENDWKTLLAIADTFLPAVEGSSLKGLIKDSSVDADELGTMCASAVPGFKECLTKSLALAPTAALNQLLIAIKVLGHKPTAVVLTGSARKLFRDMDYKEREHVLLNWHYSVFGALKKMFRSLHALCSTSYIRVNPLLHKAMGHPMVEPRLEEMNFDAHPRYDILDFGRYATAAEIETDVVIIGSGSGAGVVANRLCRDGHNVLVLEKGSYYHQSELNFNEDDAYANLYENSGVLQTEDNSMMVLAGATLGGGSTVNWSASLRTPRNVRQQWGQMAGWYEDKVYDEAMDYVMDKMGCSTEDIEEHSFSNKIILEGSEKLKYKAAEVPQNSGGHAHNCGYCSHGCASGEKQGAVVCWLREAVDTGRCKVIDNTTVLNIVHNKRGHAIGVNGKVTTESREISLNVRAKQVVSSCGSLQTPLLLKRSGFKNRHIGKGLKLHPVSVIFGEYPDRELNAFEKPIMTAVCTEFDDLDGRGHGPKIEALLHHPMLEYNFIPWRGGPGYRQDLLRYNNLAAMLIITRDRGCGSVSYKQDKPTTPSINYSPSKYDCQAILEGCIGGANLNYVQGATRIIPPFSTVPIFETHKPVEERSINDKDYQAWVNKMKHATSEPLSTPFGSAHQMSSCRMSDRGPKYSAVDGKGRLWECPNVFVADASVLPSASGVNPMISTMASAHVIAGNISAALTKKTSPKL
ncbi:hypothetical protein TRICI_001107 [Trichomonascus ciferrii]|uniref:Long-chain-alcohol oxidase n=1 Tax=Trichomonascus ciferrii TaxID=44093 RepID=A0A642VA95_9ASCO|nr:hypothetical protein TRICI_001107 [Trichomonascus ciferrii]